jgi:hypothetical protein
MPITPPGLPATSYWEAVVQTDYQVWVGAQMFDVQWTFPPFYITRHSMVLANICEVSQPEGERLDFPFMGSATMTIHNIVPHDDGTVMVRFEVDWPYPLNVRIQFAVFTPHPKELPPR